MTLLTNSIETPVTLQSEVNRAVMGAAWRIVAQKLGDMQDAVTAPMVSPLPANMYTHSTWLARIFLNHH